MMKYGLFLKFTNIIAYILCLFIFFFQKGKEEENNCCGNDVIHISDTEKKPIGSTETKDNMINNIIQIDHNKETNLLDTSLESDISDVSQIDVDNRVSMDVDSKVGIDDNKMGLVQISSELKKVIDKINQSEEPLLDTCKDLPEMGDNILFSKIIKIENRLKICKVPSLSVIGQFSLKECELIWPYLLYYQNHKKKPTVKNLSKSGSLKDRKKN